MPRAFQMGLKPLSRCSSMLADFAPMLLLRDSDLRTAVSVCLVDNSSRLSDVYREFLVSQKLRIAAECEVADRL